MRAAERLLQLLPSADFRRSVGFSSGRILLGFALGTLTGTLLALAAGKSRIVKQLLAPLISAVKAVPVASITVLALIWVTSLAIFLATSLAAEAPEAVPVIMDQCVEQTSRPAFV